MDKNSVFLYLEKLISNLAGFAQTPYDLVHFRDEQPLPLCTVLLLVLFSWPAVSRDTRNRALAARWISLCFALAGLCYGALCVMFGPSILGSPRYGSSLRSQGEAAEEV